MGERWANSSPLNRLAHSGYFNSPFLILYLQELALVSYVSVKTFRPDGSVNSARCPLRCLRLQKKCLFFIEHKSIQISLKAEDEILIRSTFVMNMLTEETKERKKTGNEFVFLCRFIIRNVSDKHMSWKHIVLETIQSCHEQI